MKKFTTPSKTSGIILCILLIFLTTCSKAPESSEEKGEPAEIMSTSESSEQLADKLKDTQKEELERDQDSTSEVTRNKSDDTGIDPAGFNNYYKIDNRLLEYSIDLHFESSNLFKTRRILQSAVAKYGFIREMNTSIDNNYPNITITARVKSESLYMMLQDLRSAGVLKRERVLVDDMTSDNTRSNIKKRREQIRISRRNVALRDYNLSKTDYSTRELYLEQSEDSMDQTEFELWQLQDRVEWATMTIQITGPESLAINVPDFSNAFITLGNGILQILYNMVEVLPFLIILALIFLKRKKLWALFIKHQKVKTNREDTHD